MIEKLKHLYEMLFKLHCNTWSEAENVQYQKCC
nr:MAG TPA: hypothetical protein [Caudoviricetes sp.]